MPTKNATDTAYAALLAAQMEMKRAQKGSTNPHFKAAYADLGNVQDACLEALQAHGFAVFQPTGQDEMGVHVKTVLAHAPTGETLECRTPLLIGKNDMQGLGSAITYARRYGLLCMSGIAPEDDDGNASAQQQKQPPKPTAEDRAAEEAAAQAEAEAKTRADDAIWAIDQAKDIADLQGIWANVVEKYTGYGTNIAPAVIAAKENMKTILKEREAA